METMTQTRVGVPWHLWVVAVIAVLFNSIGVFDFVMNMAQGAKYMASAGMTPAQIAYYQQMPMWMTGVWAIGVFGAFLASILLLMRRRIASTVFVVSLTAFSVDLLYTYVLSDGGAVIGRQATVIHGAIGAATDRGRDGRITTMRCLARF